mmetsp:Transcript_18975/g.47110  ORF Transcript_18975/g.47110 Transcript_18975/m.47110 type:complete len:293 (-) Transcript_18975:86-964(-)
MHAPLMRNLSKPSKVASILDWKKAFNHKVLTVNFHKNRVGIAVSSHPSLGVPCLELEPLRFEDHSGNRKSIAGGIDRECLERFSDIIEEHKVCGVVVNWPLQRETGRMGAACGRVLFALEQLLERSNETFTSIESSDDLPSTGHQLGGLLSRPFCLWDAGHINPKDPSKWIDDFGRCASYGKDMESTSDETSRTIKESPDDDDDDDDRYFDKEKNYYFASKEQYYEDELTVVLGVWDDFCKEHWPEFSETIETHGKDRTDSQALYSGLVPQTDIPSRLQEMTKKKKSLITMR